LHRSLGENDTTSLSGFVANALQFAVIEDMDMRIQAAMDGTDLAFSAEELWLRTLRAVPSCASSRIGARRWPDSLYYRVPQQTRALSPLIDSLRMGGDRRK
jgi:hypothetical protein